MIFSLIKKSTNQIFKNNAIITFLTVFMIAVIFIFTFARTEFLTKSLSACCFLLFVAFFSGWLAIIKKTATTKDDEIQEKNYFPIFLEAIGKNFIPILISTFLYLILLAIVVILTGIVAYKIFGGIDFIIKDISTLNITTDEQFMQYITTLPLEKQYPLYGFQLCIMATTGCLMFFLMNFYPALYKLDSINPFLKPFVAFFNSTKFLFKNFFGCLLIYIILSIFYIIFQILYVFSSVNIILQAISLFLYICFIAFAIMLIFNYYEEKTNCSNRSNCIRENETINSTSKEN